MAVGYVAVFALSALLAGLALYGVWLRLQPPRIPLVVTGSLLRSQELALYQRLENKLDRTCRVMCKVRVVDVLKPASGVRRRQWRFWFESMVQKEFDLVVCLAESMKVLAVLECFDNTDYSSARKKRDRFVLELCSGAGLPVWFVNVADSTAMDAAVDAVVGLVNAGTTLSSSGDDLPRDYHSDMAARPLADAGEHSPEVVEPGAAPGCRVCGSTMQLHQVRSGKLAGQQIWICSHYPQCRYALRAG